MTAETATNLTVSVVSNGGSFNGSSNGALEAAATATDVAGAEQYPELAASISESGGAADRHRAALLSFVASIGVTYDYSSWDHYTHVKLAWACFHLWGYADGFRRAEDAIKAFIAHSARTDGKSFHASMTRFWLQTIAAAKLEVDYYWRDERKSFRAFLSRALHSVHFTLSGWYDFTDTSLFRRFYSGAIIFSAPARAAFVQPDVQPLPTVNVRPEMLADMLASEGYERFMERDAAFLAQLDSSSGCSTPEPREPSSTGGSSALSNLSVNRV